MIAIVPRSVIGLPEPPNSRPKLAPNRAWLLCHYTGVNGYAADPSKDLAYAKSVAYYGMNRQPPIPYEYNYLIGPGGTIFEQAGTYKGAHCLNMNPESVGVLMMLGIGVQPTQAMMDSFVDLRWHLVASDLLANAHQAVPHYMLRATACPGNTLASLPGMAWPSPTGEGRLGTLRNELLRPPDVSTDGDDMPKTIDARVYDSRNLDGPFAPDEVRNVAVSLGAQQAFLRFTVVGGGTSGYLKVWADGEAEPNTSVTNWGPSDAPVNGYKLLPVTTGKVNVKVIGGPAHAIIDLDAVL